MTVRILAGDCRETLRGLPDNSVHMVCTSPPYWNLRSYLPAGHPDKALEIGSEATPEAFVQTMVDVFREVRRVLRPDGVCWMNMGDSYATGTTAARNPTTTKGADVPASWSGRSQPERCGTPAGYKTKDLLMLPARVALALQSDGWWVRSEIIWAKPNPMPESATDRPTNAHEKVFLLTKSASYFYDAHAIREARTSDEDGAGFRGGSYVGGKVDNTTLGKREAVGNTRVNPESGRNCRNVWTIATQSFSGSHFATMPAALVERCILAGTSAAGCCPSCGAPWERIVENGEPDEAARRACGADASGGYSGTSTKGHAAAGVQDASAVKARILAGMVVKRTVGWKATCSCPEHKPVPCTVLDPFGGAGTTSLVSERLGRNSIMCELNSDYRDMARQRITGDAPLFASVA